MECLFDIRKEKGDGTFIHNNDKKDDKGKKIYSFKSESLHFSEQVPTIHCLDRNWSPDSQGGRT